MPKVGFFGKSDAVEIVPGLYIGSAPERRAAAALARSGVTHVVDLRGDADQGTSRWPEGVTVWPSALVEYQAPSVDTLAAIGKRVADLLASGATVFVHCREGIQRAPMVACAALMETGWSLGDAFRLVSARRPVTAMSESQLRVLREFEASRNSHLAPQASTVG